MAGNSALDGLTRSRRQRAGGKTHFQPLGSEHTAPGCPSFQPPRELPVTRLCSRRGWADPCNCRDPCLPHKKWYSPPFRLRLS